MGPPPKGWENERLSFTGHIRSVGPSCNHHPSFLILHPSSLFLAVTFGALEHRDVAEIYRMLEWLVRLVTTLAFAISQ